MCLCSRYNAYLCQFGLLVVSLSMKLYSTQLQYQWVSGTYLGSKCPTVLSGVGIIVELRVSRALHETWIVLLQVTSPASGGFACTRLKCMNDVQTFQCWFTEWQYLCFTRLLKALLCFVVLCVCVCVCPVQVTCLH